MKPQIDRTQEKKLIDTVFNLTVSQHGYWLVNHREVIEPDIREALRKWGFKGVLHELNDINSQLVSDIYGKIENHKEAEAELNGVH